MPNIAADTDVGSTSVPLLYLYSTLEVSRVNPKDLYRANPGMF